MDDLLLDDRLAHGIQFIPLIPEDGEDVTKYSPDQPRDNEGQWTSGGAGGGSSDTSVKSPAAVESTGQPKWKKSKEPLNEYGYSIQHDGKTYEVYFDRGSSSWLSHRLMNILPGNGSNATVDHVGFNKGEVNEAITSGALQKKIDRFNPEGKAGDLKKLVDAAGARWEGLQEGANGAKLALLTEKTTGSTVSLPLTATAEDVQAKLVQVRERFRKAEQVETIKAAVDAVLPTIKAQDEIVAAVIAKLAQKPKGFRQTPVRDPETQRILYVDNVPIPD